MSEFKKEIAREAKVRIEQYEREKAQLAKAPQRIAELDGLIAEAKDLITTLEKTDAPDESVPATS